MTVIGLENVDRIEYGVVTVDVGLLQKQAAWLAGMPECDEREGLLNLLGGIVDLADPPQDEGDVTEDTDNVFVVHLPEEGKGAQ